MRVQRDAAPRTSSCSTKRPLCTVTVVSIQTGPGARTGAPAEREEDRRDLLRIKGEVLAAHGRVITLTSLVEGRVSVAHFPAPGRSSLEDKHQRSMQ